MAAGKTAHDYEDPCETPGVSELCSVYRLGLRVVFETSVEKWAAGKYCFSTGAKRENTKQAEEEAANVSTAATHTRTHTHVHILKGRSTLPESLSFPALYSEFPLMPL